MILIPNEIGESDSNSAKSYIEENEYVNEDERFFKKYRDVILALSLIMNIVLSFIIAYKP